MNNGRFRNFFYASCPFRRRDSLSEMAERNGPFEHLEAEIYSVKMAQKGKNLASGDPLDWLLVPSPLFQQLLHAIISCPA